MRHSLAALAALAVLLVIGVVGYRRLEEASCVDALYMTVVSIAAYALGGPAQYVLSGDWQTHLAKRRRRYMLENLRDHIIACGYGRVGKGVVHELNAEKLPFVIIEVDPAVVARVREAGKLALHGNAADERLLEAAGIDRARGLVVCADSDAENVYIVLTARGMRSDLSIVARASFDESESKLLRAGADRVIRPFSIAGRRMVTMLMRPDVADFIDVVSSAGGLELFVEQVQIAPASALVGQTLIEAELASTVGVSVLACHMPDGRLLMRPDSATVLQSGAELVVLGTREQLQELMRLSGHDLARGSSNQSRTCVPRLSSDPAADDVGRESHGRGTWRLGGEGAAGLTALPARHLHGSALPSRRVRGAGRGGRQPAGAAVTDELRRASSTKSTIRASDTGTAMMVQKKGTSTTNAPKVTSATADHAEFLLAEKIPAATSAAPTRRMAAARIGWLSLGPNAAK